MPDIQFLPGNTTGHDYIIGDIHGCSELLSQALNLLGPNDRLFIVGDLIDRGPDSLGVLRIVQNDPRVHVVRGNHEDVFLNAMSLDSAKIISELERYQTVIAEGKSISEPMPPEMNFLWVFLAGGGEWVFKNRDADKIHMPSSKRKIEHLLPFLPYLKEGFIPEVTSIQKYIKTLPYIISVNEGAEAAADKVQPFIVCHADLPLSDGNLNGRKMVSDMPRTTEYTKQVVLGLTSEEKAYITFARPDQFNPGIRTPESVQVYCGHNARTAMYRPETNTFNLDTGAFSSAYGLLLNHSRRQISLLTQNSEAAFHYTCKFHNKAPDAVSERKFKLGRSQQRSQIEGVAQDMVNHLGRKPLDSADAACTLSPPPTTPSSLPVVRNTATQRPPTPPKPPKPEESKASLPSIQQQALRKGLEQHRRPPTPLPSAEELSAAGIVPKCPRPPKAPR